MASLLNLTLQKVVPIRTLHTFGHDAQRADTFLKNIATSAIHASIRWTGVDWQLIDHSCKGTWLDEQQMQSCKPYTLIAGQHIRFGHENEDCFRVESVKGPEPVLLPIMHDGAPLLLPLQQTDNHIPPIAVDLDGRYVFSSNGELRFLQDGDQIGLNGRAWRFTEICSPRSNSDLQKNLEPVTQATRFCFQVSQNEEHIRLCLSSGDNRVELGERSHHYCLLTLARQRLADASLGFDLLSQGWIDLERCSKMLGVDDKHLNMLLHRARQQVATAHAEPVLAPCIERRRGEIRFGHFPFEIIRGRKLEASFDPGQYGIE